MGIIKGLRDFFWKVYRQLRRHLSKTELIIGTQERKELELDESWFYTI